MAILMIVTVVSELVIAKLSIIPRFMLLVSLAHAFFRSQCFPGRFTHIVFATTFHFKRSGLNAIICHVLIESVYTYCSLYIVAGK